eukprot:9282163-Ditylum_brightwellii.AAC.1
MSTAPSAAKRWAKAKFKAIYPALTQILAQTARTAANTTTTHHGMVELLAQLLAQQQQQQNQPLVGQIANKPEDVYSMSTTELDSLLALCRLSKGAYDSLPSYFKQINEKYQTDNTKNKIILKQITSHKYYDDVEIEVTASLPKTIQKRQCIGDEVTATYSTAHKGFSHFALADISEDEVALVNEAMELLAEATHTTTADLKVVKTKLAM